MLPACGGGSSSSGPAPSNAEKTYAQGVAAGTAATLARVKRQLDQLHASLIVTGPSGSAQGSGGFSSFARALEPRNRAALAEELQLLINRIETARSAAATADADSAEAAAAEAQRLADQALAALRLVVAADTAARAGGGEAVQTAAANALRRIATVDPMADDAEQTINDELTAALRAAEAQVEALERALAAAGGSDSDATLLQQLRTARDSLATARTNLDAANAEVDRLAAAQGANSADAAWMARGVKPGFGFAAGTGPLPTSPASSTGKKPMVKFYRRTENELIPDTYLTFGNVFRSHGTATQQGDYKFVGTTTHGAGTNWTYSANAYHPGTLENGDAAFSDTDPDFINLDPAPILYAIDQNQKQVIAENPNTGHFRARGFVYRANFRNTPRYFTDPTNYVLSAVGNSLEDANRLMFSSSSTTNQKTINTFVDQNVLHQTLMIQGRALAKGTDDTNTPEVDESQTWNNRRHTALTTFRYDADEGGLIMGFGGDGLIFADLERFQAKGCAAGYLNCNNAVTADIEIPFGAPDFDPAHQGMYYWSADVKSPRQDGTLTVAAATLKADALDGRDHGQYTLLLSNGAGANRMLSYAAYGLFSFYDSLYEPAVGDYGRVQTFHYGLEAFANDEANKRRVADMTRITGTFQGETHGWIVNRPHLRPGNYGPLRRMRGDVTLTANIGGSADDNTISGTITNLRQSPVNGSETPVGPNVPWTAGRLPEMVELKGAYANSVIGNAPILTDTQRDALTYPATVAAGTGTTIEAARNAYLAERGIANGNLGAAAEVAADGTFTGTVMPMGKRANNWEKGEYEGALYGPTTALEAAGTWWLQAGRVGGVDAGSFEWHPDQAIIGSFGAACTTGC